MSAASVLPFRSTRLLISGLAVMMTRSDCGDDRGHDLERDALVAHLLEHGRPAHHRRVDLAGRQRCVEGGDRRVGLHVHLQAVAGVDALFLHEVHDDRVEDGQREDRDLHLHPLLRDGGSRQRQEPGDESDHKSFLLHARFSLRSR
jgi:hypothetical protein